MMCQQSSVRKVGKQTAILGAIFTSRPSVNRLGTDMGLDRISVTMGAVIGTAYLLLKLQKTRSNSGPARVTHPS